MAIESHLAELQRRHQALEQEISEALAHPSTDGLKIAELKRRKLHVKDEIRALTAGMGFEYTTIEIEYQGEHCAMEATQHEHEV